MTEADFEARVTALTEDMYRVAATLLRGHHDRQDAVQECIWKAWRNLRYLRDDAHTDKRMPKPGAPHARRGANR